MWTSQNRARYDRSHLRYESGLSDEEWAEIEPQIPPARRGGSKRSVNVREVVNGIMYILSKGCQWHAIPNGGNNERSRSARKIAARGPCAESPGSNVAFSYCGSLTSLPCTVAVLRPLVTAIPFSAILASAAWPQLLVRRGFKRGVSGCVLLLHWLPSSRRRRSISPPSRRACPT